MAVLKCRPNISVKCPKYQDTGIIHPSLTETYLAFHFVTVRPQDNKGSTAFPPPSTSLKCKTYLVLALVGVRLDVCSIHRR